MSFLEKFQAPGWLRGGGLLLTRGEAILQWKWVKMLKVEQILSIKGLS